MARKILNRKDLRNAYDESERRKEEDEEQDEGEEEEEEQEDEEEEEEGEAEEEGDSGGEGEEEDEEEAPPKRKAVAKAKPKPKPKPKPRSRAPKIVRQRVIWGVFNNSHQMVASYAYPKKDEALNHATRLTTEKRSTHFVQPVKEPMEEKKQKGS